MTPVHLKNRRAAAFFLMCLMALGLSLLYRSHSQLSGERPDRQTPPAKATAVQITIASAVVPAADWKQLDARCHDDGARIADVLQDSKYITGEQNVIGTDGTIMTTRSLKPIQSRAAVGNTTVEQSLIAVSMLSVMPKINPDGSISVDVVSSDAAPQSASGSPSVPEADQFTSSVSLRSGETQILRRVQDTVNSPMRIVLITAATFDIVEGAGRRQLSHAQLRRRNESALSH